MESAGGLPTGHPLDLWKTGEEAGTEELWQTKAEGRPSSHESRD